MRAQDEKKLEWTMQTAGVGDIWDGAAAAELARRITLEVFATDASASVQATLYTMAQRLLTENAFVRRVTYALPNKHYIPVDMRWAGVDNLSPCVFRFCAMGPSNRARCLPCLFGHRLPRKTDVRRCHWTALGALLSDARDRVMGACVFADCSLIHLSCRANATVFTPIAAPRSVVSPAPRAAEKPLTSCAQRADLRHRREKLMAPDDVMDAAFGSTPDRRGVWGRQSSREAICMSSNFEDVLAAEQLQSETDERAEQRNSERG
jgi:hypothetical protein